MINGKTSGIVQLPFINTRYLFFCGLFLFPVPLQNGNYLQININRDKFTIRAANYCNLNLVFIPIGQNNKPDNIMVYDNECKVIITLHKLHLSMWTLKR